MEKDFFGWAREKERLEAEEVKVIFHEREIWWCAVGTNLGFEIDGKNEQRTRPVLIVKTFNKHFLWVVPLTSKPKEGIYYVPVTHEGQTSYLVLSQLRAISSKRLLRQLWTMPHKPFDEVRERLRNFLI
jgi:mRNA interferase MazF